MFSVGTGAIFAFFLLFLLEAWSAIENLML
jgi:hypothetical protein